MIFGSQETKETTCLVFDIGSDSVAGSWIRLDGNSRPTILVTRRVTLDIYETITAEQLLFGVKNALRQVITQLSPQYQGSPEKIFVFVASPWYAAQVRTISYMKRHPFIFSQRFADELVLREYEKFSEGKHREWKQLGTGHVPLEHKIVHVELNGYTFADPIGKKTERVELTSFMSMMPQDVRDALERIIQGSFHVDVEFHTATFASFFALAHHHHVPAHHVILDIRGETSDLVIVRDGCPHEVVSLPFGDHTIVRSFAENMHQKPTHMQELLSMYVNNHLDDTQRAQIENHMKRSLDHVEKLLYKALSHVAERGLLPKDVYVYMNPEYQAWYVQILDDHRFSTLVSSEKKFSLHDARTMLKGIIVDEEVTLDPFIVAETFFASKQPLL